MAWSVLGPLRTRRLEASTHPIRYTGVAEEVVVGDEVGGSVAETLAGVSSVVEYWAVSVKCPEAYRAAGLAQAASGIAAIRRKIMRISLGLWVLAIFVPWGLLIRCSYYSDSAVGLYIQPC
jgi:hypothetical protein